MKRTWNRAAGFALAALVTLAGCGGGSHSYHRSATSTAAVIDAEDTTAERSQDSTKRIVPGTIDTF